MKKFSLFLNSRKRPQLLVNLFNNIVEKTANLDDIELIVHCDNDDLDYLHLFSDIFSVEHPISKILRFEFIERHKSLNYRHNRMVDISVGEYSFLFNDDCEIITSKWDEIAYPLLHVFDDGIVYGHTFDNSCDKGQGGKYSSFPIISKKATDILGFYMDERFVGLGGDVGIYRIYEAINRVVHLPIHLRHVLHETVQQVNSPDETALEMRQKSWANPLDPFTLDISQEVERLQKCLM